MTAFRYYFTEILSSSEALFSSNGYLEEPKFFKEWYCFQKGSTFDKAGAKIAPLFKKRYFC